MSADEFNERFRRIEQAQARTAEDLQLLTGKILELTDRVSSLESQIKRVESQIERTQAHLDSVVSEMHEGFNRLIALNDRTNDLIELLTRLEVQNSQRLTALEHHVYNLDKESP